MCHSRGASVFGVGSMLPEKTDRHLSNATRNSVVIAKNELLVNFRKVLGSAVRGIYLDADCKFARVLTDEACEDFAVFGTEWIYEKTTHFPDMISRVFPISQNSFRNMAGIFSIEDDKTVKKVHSVHGLLAADLAADGRFYFATDRFLYVTNSNSNHVKKMRLPCRSPAFVHISAEHDLLMLTEKWVVEKMEVYRISSSGLEFLGSAPIPDGRHFGSSKFFALPTKLVATYSDLVFTFHIQSGQFAVTKLSHNIELICTGFFASSKSVSDIASQRKIFQLSEDSQDEITALVNIGNEALVGTERGGIYRITMNGSTLILPPAILADEIEIYAEDKGALSILTKGHDLEVNWDVGAVTVIPATRTSPLQKGNLSSPIGGYLDHDRLVIWRFGQLETIFSVEGYVHLAIAGGKIWLVDRTGTLFVTDGYSDPALIGSFGVPIKSLQVFADEVGYFLLASEAKKRYHQLQLDQSLRVVGFKKRTGDNVFLIGSNLFLVQSGTHVHLIEERVARRSIPHVFYPIRGATMKDERLFVVHGGQLDVFDSADFKRLYRITATTDLSHFATVGEGQSFSAFYSSANIEAFLAVYRRNLRPVDIIEEKAAILARQALQFNLR